jgi:Dolichyl-phosphate-mannose-protein mannosyltransferase
MSNKRGFYILILIVVVAATFRLWNLGYDSLGHDEAIRANRTHHGPIAYGRWIPPFTFAMLNTVQRTFGRDEATLRLPYALAGVACVLVLFAFSRRHLGLGPAVMIAAVAATHPVLVLYSRQIKVFSLEALGCALLCWAGIEAYRRRTPRALLWYTLGSVLAIGFTFTGSLVAAAWVPVLGYAYLQKESRAKGGTWRFATSAAVLLIAAVGTYVWLTGAPTTQSMKTYYDTQEIAWPTAYTLPVLAGWLIGSVKGAAFYIMGVTMDWPPLSWCGLTAQVLAISLAVGVLWRKCRPLCIALILLAVEVVLAGAMRMWPLGRLRTVTFLVPIFAIFIGCGLWEFVRHAGRSLATVGLVGLCIGLPAFRVAQSTLISPRVSEHIRPAIEHIQARLRPGDAVFVYYGASDAFEYYADINEVLRLPDNLGPARRIEVQWSGESVPVEVEPVTDRQNPVAFLERFEAWTKDHPRTWLLLAHDWRGEHKDWVKLLENDYEQVDQLELTNAAAHLFIPRDGKEPSQRLTDSR